LFQYMSLKMPSENTKDTFLHRGYYLFPMPMTTYYVTLGGYA
jgi:hypothetical protein